MEFQSNHALSTVLKVHQQKRKGITRIKTKGLENFLLKKWYRRLVIGVLTILLVYSCQTTKEKSNEVNSEALISKIDTIVSNANFNGVIAIAQHDKIVYLKAFGFSNLENKQRLQSNDQFVIGSISKQITAALILREYEKGTLHLEDKIDTHLKHIKQPWIKEVSIHHLLTHTHGIQNLNKPLDFKVGTQFQYSQLGYDLLAQILESITHKSFKQIAQELFEEFGLNHSFHPDSANYKNLVNGYVEEENGDLVYTQNSLYNYPAAGSFISNAEDLVKWNYLLHTHQILSKETLELMKQRYATRNHPIFDTIEYGYGLLFKEGESNRQIGALGYAPGFVSAAYFYPESNMNLIVLQNIAKNLNNFRATFRVHLQLMDELKNRSTQQAKM